MLDLEAQLHRTCKYCFPHVLCPHKDKLAEITAAKWQVKDDQWTPWTVIDCSLLPAGETWCDKSCLLVLRLNPN